MHCRLFLSPWPLLGNCSWLGAVPHLRQEDGGCTEEKVTGVDYLWAPTQCKWTVHDGVQADKMIRDGQAKLVILANNCLP